MIKNDGISTIIVGTTKWKIYKKISDQPTLNLREWK